MVFEGFAKDGLYSVGDGLCSVGKGLASAGTDMKKGMVEIKEMKVIVKPGDATDWHPINIISYNGRRLCKTSLRA